MEPTRNLRLTIKLIAMYDKQTLTPRGAVHPLMMHLDRTLHHRGKWGAVGVVVAGYI
jgi:hypothetical protein